MHAFSRAISSRGATCPMRSTISVFNTDGSKSRDAVVTLKTAKLEGDRLTFDVDELEGELTGRDGPTALHGGGSHE